MIFLFFFFEREIVKITKDQPNESKQRLFIQSAVAMKSATVPCVLAEKQEKSEEWGKASSMPWLEVVSMGSGRKSK